MRLTSKQIAALSTAELADNIGGLIERQGLGWVGRELPAVYHEANLVQQLVAYELLRQYGQVHPRCSITPAGREVLNLERELIRQGIG